MARGRRKAVLSTDELIANVRSEIEALEVNLKGKKDELKELLDKQKEEQKEKLIAAIEASGKSIEEVIESLQ